MILHHTFFPKNRVSIHLYLTPVRLAKADCAQRNGGQPSSREQAAAGVDAREISKGINSL